MDAGKVEVLCHPSLIATYRWWYIFQPSAQHFSLTTFRVKHDLVCGPYQHDQEFGSNVTSFRVIFTKNGVWAQRTLFRITSFLDRVQQEKGRV